MITSWQTNAEYKSFLHDYRMSLPNDKYHFFFNRRFLDGKEKHSFRNYKYSRNNKWNIPDLFIRL